MARLRESLPPPLLLTLFAFVSHRSIHEYSGESFTSKGNALVVHGGSDGIYSSSASKPNESAVPPNGEAHVK